MCSTLELNKGQISTNQKKKFCRIFDNFCQIFVSLRQFFEKIWQIFDSYRPFLWNLRQFLTIFRLYLTNIWQFSTIFRKILSKFRQFITKFRKIRQKLVNFWILFLMNNFPTLYSKLSVALRRGADLAGWSKRGSVRNLALFLQVLLQISVESCHLAHLFQAL